MEYYLILKFSTPESRIEFLGKPRVGWTLEKIVDGEFYLIKTSLAMGNISEEINREMSHGDFFILSWPGSDYNTNLSRFEATNRILDYFWVIAKLYFEAIRK